MREARAVGRQGLLWDSISEVIRVLLPVLLALTMGAVVLQLTGRDARSAYSALFRSSMGSRTAVANTLLAATPLVFTGLGATVAMRAGVFNVGVEGSLYVGAFAAAWAGFTFVTLPSYMIIPLCLVLASLVGGVWCYVPGVLKARLDISEIVTTILLNTVAVSFTSYLVNYPFRVPGLANAMSAQVSKSARLVRLAPPSQLNASFVLALIATAVIALIFKRMTLGYELRMVGDNPVFARWAGIPVQRVIEKVMLISGILGGLAGAGQILGVNYRFVANFSRGLGFTGIAIALLSRKSPIGTLLAALLFGALRSGSSTMEIFADVPRDLISVMEATIILFAALEVTIPTIRRIGHGKSDTGVVRHPASEHAATAGSNGRGTKPSGVHS